MPRSTSRKSDAGKPKSTPPRAAGRVSFSDGHRTCRTLVALGSIQGVHPAIRRRNLDLDLADCAVADLREWEPLALDVLLETCPPWVLARGHAGAKHHVVVAGGQFLAALRRLLPEESLIPVELIDGKFQEPRILHIAAAHSAALAAAACLSLVSLEKIIHHAEADGLRLMRGGAGSMAGALGLQTIRTSR